VSENSTAKPIESPAGLDLHPKAPPQARISKRAAVIGFVGGMALLCAFAWGAHLRDKAQHVSAAALGSKAVGPATSAGTEIAKLIPSGSVPMAHNPAPFSQPGTDLVPPDDVKAAMNMQNVPRGDRVIVRQPPMLPSVVPYGTQLEPPHSASPEEQERSAARSIEQQALAAPTSVRQTSASSWTQDTQLASRSAAETTTNPSALVNATAGRDVPAASQNTAKASSEYDEQNMQARKESFIANARGSQSGDYLRSMRTAPLTAFEIQAGWEIPAVLEQAINSDLPGEIKALVMSNVYDTATGRFLLVPQGSRLIGLYDSHVGYAQNGVQVIWSRVIYPDGSSLDLEGMMGLDSHGNAGLRYQVDNHYKRLVGFAVLTSLFTAAFELSQNRQQSTLAYPSAGQIAGGAVGQEVSQLGEQITRRNLNVQPTIKIPPGYKFNVHVNRDIVFDAPYAPLVPAR
jgi:type IV secretion system protein VirB10